MVGNGIIKAYWSAEYTPGALSKGMFYYIQSCGHFHCNKDYSTNRKDYNSILLLYTVKGSGILEYRGNSYELYEDTVFIIDCLEQQCYTTKGDDIWEFYYVHISGSESRKYCRRIIENFGPVLNLNADSIVLFNMKRLSRLTSRRDTKIDILASCLIVEILTELLMLCYSFNAREAGTAEYVKSAIDIIESKYSRKLTLEQIASDISINKFYLSKLFKMHTSESLYEYILNFRINKSKELLRTTQFPVCVIAEKVGFESASNFIKTFKKNEEITPLQFRKLWN
jgi:AraC-like DNA-binding protein